MEREQRAALLRRFGRKMIGRLMVTIHGSAREMARQRVRTPHLTALHESSRGSDGLLNQCQVDAATTMR